MPEAAFVVLQGILLQQSTQMYLEIKVSIELLHESGMYWWLACTAVTARVNLCNQFLHSWLYRWASYHIPCRKGTPDSGWGKDSACGWPVHVGRTSTGQK